MHHTSQMPLNYIRDFNPERDYPALAVLANAVEDHDHLGEPTSEEDLRAVSQRCTRWVAEDSKLPSSLLAHGWVQSQSPTRCYFSVFTHPNSRRTGLGGAMFSYGITLAKKVGASQLVTCVRSDQQAEVLFLEKRGFQQMGYDRFLKATPNLSHEEPVWPEGFTIRSMAEINDLEVLMKAHNLCYARHWGHYENSTILTVEKVREWMDKNPQGFIHEGIFILFSPTNEIAGVVYGRFAGSGEKRTLIVDSPGVAPEYQHLDLLRPLTLQALQWLRYQGSEPIELHCWGENEETIAVYTKLGFSITPEDIWIEYMRPIP